MKIKICGLKRIDDIDYVNEFLPDFAGFIFAGKSKRYISLETAVLLKSRLNKTIKSVGVFVNENIEKIIETAKMGVIEFIQLHGDENNEFINLVKEKTKLPIIKAFRADKNLTDTIRKTQADFVLIDTVLKNQFGGTGSTFDWDIIPKDCRNRLFLAGGLNACNIKNAMEKVSPYCIDINSGVETDENKDREKIKKVFEIVKGNKNE